MSEVPGPTDGVRTPAADVASAAAVATQAADVAAPATPATAPAAAATAPAVASAAAVPPRRRHALIVVGSSGRFDARAHRIASTLAARGHLVTVIGRAGRDAPAEELLGDGTRVVRVPVSAVDGLPLPDAIRRPLVSAWDRRHRSGRGQRLPAQATSPLSPPSGARTASAGRGRRAVAGLVRILAVVLSVRSQVRGARRRVRELDMRPDVVLGLGFMGLPVALGAADAIGADSAGRPPVIYDASDIYVDAGNIARLPGPIRHAFGVLERRWARRAALVTTANDGYADVLGARFGIRRPLVLLNCPPLVSPSPDAHPLRGILGAEGERPIVLYHGGISPDRGIEQLIEAVGLLGETRPAPLLVVMGYGPLETALHARIAAEGLEAHVRLLPPVEQDVLVSWIADADVAAMPIQPTTLNHRLTVPNKLFEAMAAGVPILASDLPGMAPIVRAVACGLLVDPTSPAAIAAGISRLLAAPDEERAAWRDAGRRAARERYSWEREAPKLLDALAEVSGGRW